MRGVIQNRERALQVNDFSGLALPHGVTPTDLDGAIEIKDRLFIFFELKANGKEVPYGQKLFLERMCRAIDNTKSLTSLGYKRRAFALIAHHNTPIGEDVKCHDAIVTAYFSCGEWHKPATNMTLRQAIDIVYARLFDKLF